MRWLIAICIFLVVNTNAQSPRLMVPIGHTNAIKSIAFSKDGKFIVTGSEDKTVKVWDVNTGSLLQNFAIAKDRILSVDFNPNSKTIIACSEDGFLYEWDIYSGELLNTIVNKGEMMGACTFSPNGQTIAISYGYHFKDFYEIVLYNCVTKKITAQFKAHKEKIHKLIFSPDGKQITSSSYDQMIRVWDAVTSKMISEKDVSTPKDLFIKSIQYNKDGTQLLVCNVDSKLSLYNSQTLKLLQTIANDTIKFSTASYSRDGKKVVAAGASGQFYILDAATWNVEKYFRTEDPNEQFTSMDILQFNNSDTRILAISGIVGLGKVYDVASCKVIYKLHGNSSSVFSAKFSYPTVFFVAAYNDQSAKIWSLYNGRLIGSLRGHTSLMGSVSFSKDAKYVVTSSWDKTARIWDWAKIKTIKTFNLPNLGGENVELSADNKKLLACMFMDSSANVYDASSGALLYSLRGNDHIKYATFSPDAKTIATACSDGTISLWNADNGLLLKTFTGHDKIVTCVKFSWNNKFLASSSIDSTAKFWNLATGTCMATLKGHADLVNYVDMGTMPKYLVTASDDKTAKVWDAIEKRCLFTLEGHTDKVTCAEYDKTGEYIITTSADNTCKLWNAKTGKLIVTFIAIGTKDFITMAADGYYQASPNASKLLYYVTKDLKTISFDQLDLKYNRPDIILQRLGSKDTTLINSYKNAYFKRVKKVGVDTASFTNAFSVPVLDIVNAGALSTEQKTNQLKLKIHAADKSIYLNKFNVWVNETPIFGMKGINLKRRKIKSFDTTITITLSTEQNTIETSVVNYNGTESYRSPLTIQYKPINSIQPKTYFIGIGINRFKEEGHNLNWSVKDIHDLVLKFKEKHGSSFIADTLYDENVTAKNIAAIKARLKKLTVNDKVILAYSGHGMLNKDFDYYLSTYSVDFNKPENGGLLYDELENLFDGIAPRKKLMMIDACHSGEVDKEELIMAEQSKAELAKQGVKGVTLKVRPVQKAGSKNSVEIMQNLFANVSRSTGTTVISAAGGTQYALEKGSLQNGVFTYSVIEAMGKFKSMTVQNLKQNVSTRVVQLTNGMQKPNSRAETNVTDWNVW
jgi:WD40 repeat protein